MIYLGFYNCEIIEVSTICPTSTMLGGLLLLARASLLVLLLSNVAAALNPILSRRYLYNQCIAVLSLFVLHITFTVVFPVLRRTQVIQIAASFKV